MTFLDETNIRAHQKAAGAPRKRIRRNNGTSEASGRSWGGFGTKACVITDAIGRAIAFMLAPDQDHELPHAVPLLDKLPGMPKWWSPTGATAATPCASTSGA